MARERPSGVRIPVLTSRTHVRWLVATGLALAVMLVWAVLTRPQDRPAAVVVAVLATVGVVTVLWSSTWLDVDRGVVTRVRWGLLRREVRLRPGTSVEVVPNGGGQLMLTLRSAGARRRMYVPLFELTDYVERSQPPRVLRAIADALERHRVGGARLATVLIRRQAEAVEAGVEVRSTPFAGMVTHGVVTAAKGGGAAGAGGSLLG